MVWMLLWSRSHLYFCSCMVIHAPFRIWSPSRCQFLQKCLWISFRHDCSSNGSEGLFRSVKGLDSPLILPQKSKYFAKWSKSTALLYLYLIILYGKLTVSVSLLSVICYGFIISVKISTVSYFWLTIANALLWMLIVNISFCQQWLYVQTDYFKRLQIV